MYKHTKSLVSLFTSRLAMDLDLDNSVTVYIEMQRKPKTLKSLPHISLLVLLWLKMVRYQHLLLRSVVG